MLKKGIEHVTVEIEFESENYKNKYYDQQPDNVPF